MMPTLRMLGGFTGGESLVHDGSVGARLIQAFAHVHRGGGGGGAVNVKLLPSAVDLICTQVGGDFLPGGGGFAGNVLSKPAEFLAPRLRILPFTSSRNKPRSSHRFVDQNPTHPWEQTLWRIDG